MGTRVILFYEKCRLCLNKPGTTNIFQKEGLKQDIFNCTGVLVSAKESLPEKICSDCLDVIVKAKELKALATMNDSYLKDLFCDDDTLELPTQTDSDTTQNTQSENSILEPIVNTSNKKNTKHSSQTKGLQIRKDIFKPAAASSPISKIVKNENQTSHKSSKRKATYEIDANKCETCDKSFDTYKKLYQHMRQHEKKYKCPLDVCEKKFATKGDLEKHLRTHTGVKPFSCDICDKKFAQKVTLRSHKENVHHCFSHVLK